MMIIIPDKWCPLDGPVFDTMPYLMNTYTDDEFYRLITLANSSATIADSAILKMMRKL